jgi:hypothetical protein
MDDLKSKVEELELYFELGEGKMVLAGFKSKVDKYIEFMNEKEKEMKEKDGKKSEIKSNSASKSPSVSKSEPIKIESQRQSFQ